MSVFVCSQQPIRYDNNSNFKLAPYYAWVNSGGKVTSTHYGWRKMRSLLRLIEPFIPRDNSKAILCFAEPPTLDIDAFPWWGCREIIPVLWDCWPKYWNVLDKWFRCHHVKSVVFTSSQVANEFRRRFPQMNVLTITEGIETKIYHGEKKLQERKVDFLQYGRVTALYDKLNFGDDINFVSSHNEESLLHTREDLITMLSESKIVLAVPRCDMQPDVAQGIETLTQRYWECMLSGGVTLGRAPKELIDLIGYDPVVQIDNGNVENQIRDMVAHIDEYQPLVDRNKRVAQQQADWIIRIKQIKAWLIDNNYAIKE